MCSFIHSTEVYWAPTACNIPGAVGDTKTGQ